MSRVPIRIAARNKYSAKRTDGYASKREAKRAGELELLQKLGEITGLEKQVRFELIPGDELGRAISYVADFTYYNNCGHLIVEDSKGMRTPVYKLKRRLMYRIHFIEIQEV